MERYGSFQTEAELERGADTGVRTFRAVHVESRQAGVLKVVAATASKREGILAAFKIQQELAAAHGGTGWLSILEFGETPTECYAVFETAEPQLVNDIDGAFEPPPQVVGQVCKAILEALIRLKKEANGRPHGNLKLSNVLLRSTAAGEADYGHVLLTDLLPLNPSGPAPPRSDQRALGVLLYQFIRAVPRARPQMQSIPDDRPLWPVREEKRDAEWRKFVEGLMKGEYDNGSLESVLRDCKRLMGESKGKWMVAAVAGVAILILAGAGVYLMSSHKGPQSSPPPPSAPSRLEALKSEFRTNPDLQGDADLRAAFSADDENTLDAKIQAWWTNPEVTISSNVLGFADRLNAVLVDDLKRPPELNFSSNLVASLVAQQQRKKDLSKNFSDLTNKLATIYDSILEKWALEAPEASNSVIKAILFKEVLAPQIKGATLDDFNSGADAAGRILDSGDYAPPKNWRNMADCLKSNALARLTKMANGQDQTTYAQWKVDSATAPQHFEMAQLLPEWPGAKERSRLRRDIASVNEDSSLAQFHDLAPRVGKLLTDFDSLKSQAEDLENKAKGDCANSQELKDEGGLFLKNWSALNNDLNGVKESLRTWKEAADNGKRQAALEAEERRRKADEDAKARQVEAARQIEQRNLEEKNLLTQLHQDFNDGNYQPILNTNLPNNPEFSQIFEKARQETAERNAANKEFEEGHYTNYAFIRDWGGFKNKSGFASVMQSANNESNSWANWTARLNDNPQATIDFINDPANSAVASKGPFKVLLDEAKAKVRQLLAARKAQEDLKTAQADFDLGKYDDALKLSASYPQDDSFVNLSKSATTEKAMLDDANRRLAARDPDFITFVNGLATYRNTNKPPWTNFFFEADKVLQPLQAEADKRQKLKNVQDDETQIRVTNQRKALFPGTVIDLLLKKVEDDRGKYQALGALTPEVDARLNKLKADIQEHNQTYGGGL
ncbi:MAG TPA: hypothetical protein VH595_10835 [Verrucomicrobiae bacterium]|jgi:hypothetical protein|nr:hypothetical protein [Verrucomicrobiae bacterium]